MTLGPPTSAQAKTAEIESTRELPSWRLADLNAYMADVLVAMGLTEWHVTLVLDGRPDNADASAQVRTTRNRLRARVLVGHDYFDQDRAEQRHIVVHELCHLLVRGLHDLLYEGVLEEVMGKPAAVVFLAAANDQLEQAVDRMATIYAGHVALPVWSTGPGGEVGRPAKKKGTPPSRKRQSKRTPIGGRPVRHGAVRWSGPDPGIEIPPHLPHQPTLPDQWAPSDPPPAGRLDPAQGWSSSTTPPSAGGTRT